MTSHLSRSKYIRWLGGNLAPLMLWRARRRHGSPDLLDAWYWRWAARDQKERT